jgi:hypothetical protein
MRIGFVADRAESVAAYTGASLNNLATAAEGHRAVFRATAGTTYLIAVESADADAVLSWRPPPPNDNFAHAATLVGRSGRVRGLNVSASRETGEPRLGAGARASVWYRWRAPGPGVLRLSTGGSTFDTVLGVYRGIRLRTLHRLANDDDSGPGNTSATRIRVHRGRTYRIAVDGYRGAIGRVVLHWTLVPSRV